MNSVKRADAADGSIEDSPLVLIPSLVPLGRLYAVRTHYVYLSDHVLILTERWLQNNYTYV